MVRPLFEFAFQRGQPSRIRFVILFASLVLTGHSLADETTYQFSVPEQELAKTLRDIATVTGSQLLFDGALVQGRLAAKLEGEYTAAKAIETVLHGSNLTYSTTRSDVYLVTAREKESPPRMLDAPSAPAVPQPIPNPSETSDRSQTHEEAGARALDEIIVHAMRRADNLQEVPMSVTTMSRTQLLTVFDGGADVRGIAGRLPSLYVEGSSGRTAPRFYVRGLGNTDFDLTASQPVSVVMDDIVMENVLLKGFPIFDIEAVELLRGPQGTLFGRNTPAGTVRFTTNKPKDEFEGYVSASYGNLSSSIVRAVLNSPVSDRVSARLAFQHTGRGDFVDNVAESVPFARGDGDLGGFSDVAGRLHLAFLPKDSVDVLLTIQNRSLNGTTTLFRANVLDRGSNRLNDSFDRRRVFYDGGRNNASRVDTSSISASVRIDFGSIELTSISGFFSTKSSGIADVDGGAGIGETENSGFIPAREEAGTRGNKFRQFTQESRLTGETNNAAWHAGLFYFRDSFAVDNLSFDGVGGELPVRIARLEQDTDAWAMFGQLTYDFTPRFSVSAGLRYTYDRKDFAASRPVALAEPITTPLLRTVNDTHLSWDLSTDYLLTDTLTAYLRIANGFRSPTVQGRLLFSDVVTVADSETVSAFDIGVKSELLGKRLRLNASAYYYRIDDQQFTAVGGDGNLNRLINARRGEGFGAEIDAAFLLGQYWDVTVGVSLNETRIRDSTLRVLPCASPCTVLDPISTIDGVVVASVDGNPFPQAPLWIASATIDYVRPVSPSGDIFFHADWAWQGRTNFFLYESAEFQSSGNAETGVRIGYRRSDESIEWALFVRNMFDEENLVGGVDFNNLTGFVNEPRVWGAEFAYRF